MSRREQIKMSEQEVSAFLAEERTVVCASAGPRGWPHLMPLWYVLRARETTLEPQGETPLVVRPEPQIWAWTYAASQKTRNLERDPRATLQVEAGESYQELRGVMFETEVVIHRDLDTVAALGQEIFARYASPRGQSPPAELHAEVGAMVERQAAKRVAFQFLERRRASWDHRKLGGTY